MVEDLLTGLTGGIVSDKDWACGELCEDLRGWVLVEGFFSCLMVTVVT